MNRKKPGWKHFHAGLKNVWEFFLAKEAKVCYNRCVSGYRIWKKA